MKTNAEVSPEQARASIQIEGVVQGVGFRPFVYELACELGLVGHVSNSSSGVHIEVQGPPQRVVEFAQELPRRAPPLAFIVEMQVQWVPVQADAAMRIVGSHEEAHRTALLPPDVAACDECLRELRCPSDRRFRYPFINCTNCGPRYTIINDIPYDRDKTTMAGFEMCEDCQREYRNPRDRRFHAQPNACPRCGPRVWLADPNGQYIDCDDPVSEAARRLAAGQIVAIKGLGGFHLAADATNEHAVARLRTRKHREAKPLAVMCRDEQEARRHAELDDLSWQALTSKRRPIVIVERRPDSRLCPSIAPDNHTVGLMLPYTPLHSLLLDNGPASLVMTSGNVTDEPIAIDNQDAFERLGAIADSFLVHDRDILVRNDDSVTRVIAGSPRPIRRSRGYVPLPVMLKEPVPCVLGVGGELKNTLCLTRGRMAFMSQHLGDQSNEPAYEAFLATVQRFMRLLDVRPERIGCDLHPDYLTSQWAEAQDLPLMRVQHHHAHIASCLAEHQHAGPVLGLALDGTGLGNDGTVWGGEILVCDQARFARVGHLLQVPLPGGDRAIREPWRMAVAHLRTTYEDQWREALPKPLHQVPDDKLQAVASLTETGSSALRTSSCGRLFDAVAALCGLHPEAAFEAQAAIALESQAARAQPSTDHYACELRFEGRELVIDTCPMIRSVIDALHAGQDVPRIALSMHRGLAAAFAQACEEWRVRTGLQTVALSGGVMQNKVFAEALWGELRRRDFEVLMHTLVPPNDGGLALGQAVVAAHAIST